MQFKRYLAIALMCILMLGCFPAGAEKKAEPTATPAPEVLYSIDVDIINQIVTVYRAGAEKTEENIVRQMICSTGYGNSTPRGTFEMCPQKYAVERQEWYYFTEFEVWAKWASRIKGPYLFHSILFPSRRSGPTWASSHALGSKASHGCVRLRVDDAKWVALNCPPGTSVYIHEDNERTPDFEDLRAILLNASFSIDNTSYAEFRKGIIPLSKGSRYSKVLDMQEKLNEQGYDCGDADGIFGSDTEKAVKAWQAAMGVDVDGVVTPNQLEAILANATPAPTPTPTPAPTPEPTPDVSAMEGTIAIAMVETGTHLNLRSAADKQATVIASLPHYAILQVLEETDEWLKVSYQNQTGWVSHEFADIAKREGEVPAEVEVNAENNTATADDVNSVISAASSAAAAAKATPAATPSPRPTAAPTPEPTLKIVETARPTEAPTRKPANTSMTVESNLQSMTVEAMPE